MIFKMPLLNELNTQANQIYPNVLNQNLQINSVPLNGHYLTSNTNQIYSFYQNPINTFLIPSPIGTPIMNQENVDLNQSISHFSKLDVGNPKNIPLIIVFIIQSPLYTIPCKNNLQNDFYFNNENHQNQGSIQYPNIRNQNQNNSYNFLNKIRIQLTWKNITIKTYESCCKCCKNKSSISRFTISKL